MFVTYKISCQGNNKNYYGSTNHFPRRKSQHLHYLRNNLHVNKHLQNAYNLYGEELFTFDVLDNFDNKESMEQAEQNLIDMYLDVSFNKSKSAKSPQLFGEQNGFFGKKHSEETKIKMKKAKEGKSNWTKNSIVITEKGIFASIKLACIYHAIQRSTYFRRLKRGTSNWVII
jgi:group I intron endonuclease